MANVFDELKERGYIAQSTGEEEVRKLLGSGPVTFYIGFDPTADSLHVGSFLQLMVMSRLQKAGHRPIALVGGGTALVGDPTGKTDMRKMLTREQIAVNSEAFRRQMSRFIDFSPGKALLVDNADWLLKLEYVPFLREIGVHFTVNRMLTAECFKSRMEKGLTFIEFNYMLMQAYDFLKLFRDQGCTLQLGGDDQWSNILAGTDLVRRVEGKDVQAMTFTLLTTSEGKKMGKTEKGAVWLDPAKTPPYEFYQYWRNVDDKDVGCCLALLTYLPMDEVNRLASLKDAEINEAKKALAFEVTKIVHGEAEAVKAKQAAESLFGGGGVAGSIPEITGLPLSATAVDLVVASGNCSSKGEARRLIAAGGVSVDGVKVVNPVSPMSEFPPNGEGVRILQIGKKHKWVVRVTG
jgi:tyrosyl-tRNA synthetase